MKKLTVEIERGKDGSYGICTNYGDLPFLVLGDGHTAQEAKSDFLAVYEAQRESYKAKTGEDVEVEFAFTYDIPSFLSFYNNIITLSGLSRLTGINKAQLSHYVTGTRNPSPATEQRIKTSIKQFADELSCVFA